MPSVLLRVLTIAFVVVAVALSGCPTRHSPDNGGSVGNPAPTAPPASVSAFLHSQGLEGKVTLIEFGTLGCKLSEEGLLQIAKWRTDQAIPNLHYLRVEAAEDAKTVKAYFDEKAPGFPWYHDPSTSVAKLFDATTYPCFVLMGKYGHVRYRGKFPAANIDEWAEALVAEKRDPGTDVPLLGTVALDPPKLLASTRLPDLAGQVKPLSEYTGDGGVVLVFVDTTCPFSGTAIGEMPSVAKTLAAQKIPSVLVNLDDTADRVRQYYTSRDAGVPVVYDDTTNTKLKWNIHSVPTVVYVNAEGKIAYNGKALWAELAKTIPGGGDSTPQFEPEGTGYG